MYLNHPGSEWVCMVIIAKVWVRWGYWMRVTWTLFVCAVCLLAHVVCRVCSSSHFCKHKLADLHPISINPTRNLSMLSNFWIPYQTASRPFGNTNGSKRSSATFPSPWVSRAHRLSGLLAPLARTLPLLSNFENEACMGLNVLSVTATKPEVTTGKRWLYSSWLAWLTCVQYMLIGTMSKKYLCSMRRLRNGNAWYSFGIFLH